MIHISYSLLVFGWVLHRSAFSVRISHVVTVMTYYILEEIEEKMSYHASDREYNLWIEGILIFDMTPIFSRALVIPKHSRSWYQRMWEGAQNARVWVGSDNHEHKALQRHLPPMFQETSPPLRTEKDVTGRARTGPMFWESLTPLPAPTPTVATRALFILYVFHIDKYRSVPQASFFLGSCIQHLCYSQRAPPLTSLPWQLALHCPAHHQMPKVRPSNWNPLFLSMKIPCYIQTPYYTQDGSEQAEDIELYLLQLWMNTFKSIVRHSIQWKDSSGRRW